MKFTPGPWRYDGHAYIFGPKREMVAMIRGTGENLPEEANARLIAAAPELLDELKRLKQEINGALHAFETTIRAAIGNTNFAVIQARIKAAETVISKAEGE